MTEIFLRWQQYNQQVDLIFGAVCLGALVLLAVGWLVFKTSLRVFGLLVKVGVSLAAIVLVVLWVMDWLPL